MDTKFKIESLINLKNDLENKISLNRKCYYSNNNDLLSSAIMTSYPRPIIILKVLTVDILKWSF